jgi:hypothetical protein
MRVKINTPCEFDRHEAEIRFEANADGRQIGVSATVLALAVIRDAKAIKSGDPKVIFAAGGDLLEAVVADVIQVSQEPMPSYLVTHVDVLRVTGNELGFPHVPKPWKRL